MSAGESLWHGYSTDALDRLAWSVVEGDGRAGEADAYELFEIVWFERERDSLARRVNERYGELSQARAERDEAIADRDRAREEIARIQRQHSHALERANAAEAKLHQIALLKVWTNEDGKRFAFVDDLAAALGVGEGR